MKPFWFYSDWTGKPLELGSDELYRRTLLIRMPFTTRAVVIAISRVGKLYEPELFPDPNFERWVRVYR